MNGLRQFDPNASTAFARRNGIRKMDLSPSCRQSGRWRAWLFMNKCYGLTVGSEDCGPMPFVSGIERIHAVRYACSLRRRRLLGACCAGCMQDLRKISEQKLHENRQFHAEMLSLIARRRALRNYEWNQ